MTTAIGPGLPAPQTPRAITIQAIRDLAAWLEEHPFLPIPHTIQATAILYSADEVDDATRIAAIESAAAAFGVEMIEGEHTTFMTTHPFPKLSEPVVAYSLHTTRGKDEL